MLLAREDVLAVEQHRVITERGELGCVAVIEAGTRVAGEDHDDRAFAGGGGVCGLVRARPAPRGGDAPPAARARHEETRRPTDATSPHTTEGRQPLSRPARETRGWAKQH